MDIILQQKCDELVANRQILKSTFKWNNDFMNLAAGCMYTGMGQKADPEALKQAEAILKAKTGALSEFRGNVKVPILCKMTMTSNPEAYLEKVQSIYSELNKGKILENEYKILAAMTICDHIGEEEPTPYITKTMDLYKRMKEEHKWITSDEDIPFAAMLAVSGLDTEKLMVEMENDYAILKETFRNSNAVQSLSHVLAVNEKPSAEKCQMVVSIFEELKKAKHKYGMDYMLASLGSLTLLDKPVSQLVQEIIDADEYLKTQKGFGSLSLGSDLRRMYAAQMVLDVHMPQDKNTDSALLGAVLAYTIAMEVCMIIIMSSVAATTVNN